MQIILIKILFFIKKWIYFFFKKFRPFSFHKKIIIILLYKERNVFLRKISEMGRNFRKRFNTIKIPFRWNQTAICTKIMSYRMSVHSSREA